MPIFVPIALAGLFGLLAGTSCNQRKEEIIIGPEPIPHPPKSAPDPETVLKNNPLFRKGRASFTSEMKKSFLRPLQQDTFKARLSPDEKLALRKLAYRNDRVIFYTEAYNFARFLSGNGKTSLAQKIYGQLLSERFSVPLEIRDLAQRQWVESHRAP